MRIRSVLVLLFVAIFMAAGLSTATEVYKTVDEDGNVTFTDSPPKDKPAEKVELKKTNTQPPIEFRSRPTQNNETEEIGGYDLRIISPAKEQQMGPTQMSLPISVETSRPLEEGHSFQIMLNGTFHGPTSQSSNLSLTKVSHGRKQVAVSIVDSEGSVIETSEPVTIFAIRPNPGQLK